MPCGILSQRGRRCNVRLFSCFDLVRLPVFIPFRKHVDVHLTRYPIGCPAPPWRWALAVVAEVGTKMDSTWGSGAGSCKWDGSWAAKEPGAGQNFQRSRLHIRPDYAWARCGACPCLPPEQEMGSRAIARQLLPCCHTQIRAGRWPMLGVSDSFLDCPPIVETTTQRLWNWGRRQQFAPDILHFLDPTRSYNHTQHLGSEIRLRNHPPPNLLPTHCPPCPTASRATALDPRIKLTPLPSAISARAVRTAVYVMSRRFFTPTYHNGWHVTLALVRRRRPQRSRLRRRSLHPRRGARRARVRMAELEGPLLHRPRL